MASHGVARPSTVISRNEEEKAKEQNEIREYRDLEDLIRQKVAKKEYSRDVFDLTSKLLKKNPEYYSMWNIRRRVLINCFSSRHLSSSLSQENTVKSSTDNSIQTSPTLIQPMVLLSKNNENPNYILDLIRSDLEFLFPIMLKFPKCYWLWNYRLWLLQQANERLDSRISRELWIKELNLVGKMLMKDSRNFHGWDYRRMVVLQLESCKLYGKSMVESEFEYTTKMIRAPNGLSNFSAWHRRSKLIPQLLNERGSDSTARRQLLDDEFDLIISAMYTDSYPYQQSAWFYYQFLMTTLIEPEKSEVIVDFSRDERCEYVRRQLKVLENMLDGAEDCKWTYICLINYTLAISEIEGRMINSGEIMDCNMWLKELRKLDLFRKGRWDDLERVLTQLPKISGKNRII